MNWLQEILAHPLTRGMNIDAAGTTVLRACIVQKKGLLRKIYEDWYRTLKRQIPTGDGLVLELGSGSGFLRNFVPHLVTSDILPLPDINIVLNAHELPFRSDTLRAIVMVDVLHHLSDVRRFFHEATRCVRTGGRVIMIEPWVSSWSRIVYGKLHHEPFLPEHPNWEFDSSGALSGANGALPWIVFYRDLKEFERSFPMWTVEKVGLEKPFVYLLSGGVSLRAFSPGITYSWHCLVEKLLKPWMPRLAMFAVIVLAKE